MDNIIIRAIPLPPAIRAFTLPDEQGDYNIYLNSSLSDEQQKQSLCHEKDHIANGDFYSSLTSAEIEAARTKRAQTKK